MSLPQPSRIAFSRYLVSAPQMISTINSLIAQLIAAQASAQITETANEGVWTMYNNLIDLYQPERQYLTGIAYTTTNLASDITNPILQNSPYYAPMVTAVGWPLASTVPYALGLALGADLNGNFASITPESSDISTLQAAIAAAQSGHNVANQITGQTCPVGGSGANGVNLITIPSFLTASNAAAVSWIGILNSEISALNTIIAGDLDPTRNAAAIAAKANANTALAAITTWHGLTDTIPYTQVTNLTQTQFNAATASSSAPAPAGLDPTNITKLNPINLATLNAAIAARNAFLPTRTSQLASYFGTYSQTLSTGVLTGITVGWYYYAYLAIQSMISLAGGSLTTVRGLKAAIDAQQSQLVVINNQVTAYSALLTCSAFAADATGTNQVSLLNSSGFSVSDAIYFVSDTADEIPATITAINGKRLTLSKNIASRYLTSDYARLYKDLT